MAEKKNKEGKYHNLPLLWHTPASWASHVLNEPLLLLNDHAHLEKKAAANALDLVHRYPGITSKKIQAEPLITRDPYQDRWVRTLSTIAREESEHLSLVIRILQRRGGQLSKFHTNPYAAQLRKKVRMGQGPHELIDRLMVSALIEVRSCERFLILSEFEKASKSAELLELTKLYRGLVASEMGHYTIFFELAEGLSNHVNHVQLTPEQIESTWQDWLEAEAEIIQAQAPGYGMHSGVLT